MTTQARNTALAVPIEAKPKAKLSNLALLGGGVLSTGVALFSYRYLAKVGPVPPTVANNQFFNPWIIIHVAGAATALLFGPAQFLPAVRRRWPRVHRWVGRTYIAGCLAGGVSGLVLAAGVSSGATASAGFGALGAVWLLATAQGWRTARSRQWSKHPQWMVRSFALTFSAVTLRIYMLLAGVLGLDMMSAYPKIAWLCWVPNVFLAEVYLRTRRRANTELAPDGTLTTQPDATAPPLWRNDRDAREREGVPRERRMMMVTMRAALHDRYGAPDVLHEAVVDRPVPTATELLVRVEAASVNGYDTLMRSGALKMMASRKFPKLTGIDFVGEVVHPSPGASFRPGDRVWGVLPLHRLGSFADYVAIESGHIATLPAGFSATDAAALPVTGATALAALRDVAGLRSGERLLVRGASGGVGSIAVQLGKTMGAHVTGLASAGNLAFVREQGADRAVDYAKVKVSELSSFDVILDTVGSDIASYRRLLAPGGRMAAIVPDPRHPLLWMAYIAFSRIHGGRRVRYFSAKPDTAILTDLARHVEAGTVRPTVAGVFPLSRVTEAHRAFELRRRPGKQIIDLGPGGH